MAEPTYRLFRPKYTVNGETRESPTWNVAFRDHLRRRQTVAAFTNEARSRKFADRLMELVECRQNGDTPAGKLQRWIDSLPDRLRRRLIKMDLIEATAATGEIPLLTYLDGRKDDSGAVTLPGYQQALEARGATPAHVTQTVKRVRNVLDGCGFVFWRDMTRPGAVTAVQVYLGKLRDDGRIGAKTFNYYVRDLKGFCRWMADEGHAPAVALAKLKKLKNADADSEARRALLVPEMLWLLRITAAAGEAFGLTGEERAFLYRFAFETGIRPGQIRALTVRDFDLDATPPTVTTQARYVKRRLPHTQVLTSPLAAELRRRFKTKVPAAPALKMPSKYDMADMLREDLAAARAAWIDEKGISDEEREKRQRSDFLAEVNHQGERAVFYSTRHGHGTALAEAGVAEKDIAKSMHHTSTKTTRRYLHSSRRDVERAVAALPDLSYPQAQQNVATGTNGPEPTANSDVACAAACATGWSPMESGGESAGDEKCGNHAENAAIRTGEATEPVAQLVEQRTFNP